MGKKLEPELAPVIMRAIHTTADFDYADHLKFSEHAVEKAREAIKNGGVIITDTKMGWFYFSLPDQLIKAYKRRRGISNSKDTRSLSASK